ncbi:MAG: hypothetical protein PHE56_09505 [Bacteroidales bacterium]|nr:hypothetical protein [Bacteroidales bacterium]
MKFFKFNWFAIIAFLLSAASFIMTITQVDLSNQEANWIGIFSGIIAFLAILLVFFNIDQVSKISRDAATKEAGEVAKQETLKVAKNVVYNEIKKKIEKHVKEILDNDYKELLTEIIESKMNEFAKNTIDNSFVPTDLTLVVEDIYNNSRLQTLPFTKSLFDQSKSYQDIILKIKEFNEAQTRDKLLRALRFNLLSAYHNKKLIKITLSNSDEFITGTIINMNHDDGFYEVNINDTKTVKLNIADIKSVEITN